MSGVPPVERLLARLDNVQPSGAGHTARCPVHDDRENSLKVDTGDDGRALIRCYTGCKPEAVVAALGLKMADLYPPNERMVHQNGHGRRIIATYDYHDTGGALLYQAVRYDPKGFAQRQPDGKGGWLWNLTGTPRVLYRLPELLTAHPSAPVCLTEGEKDADRLAALGFVATTNAAGADQWRSEYAESLRDRRVVILEDNDAAGRKRTRTVGDAVDGVASETRVLALPDLPEKGDLSDWLDAGGNVDELRRLIAEAPLWEPSDTSHTSGHEPEDTDDTDDGSRLRSDNGGRRPSQATALVSLATESGVELFHDPNGEPYASFGVADRWETAPIRSGHFRGWLAKRFYDRYEGAPGSQATQDALTVLAGKATFEGATLPVWVRLAPYEDRLYLDLADEAWRAVEIAAASWRVVASEEVPVKFRRPSGMLPLPSPDPAGSLQELDRFINVAEPDDLLLILGWLVGTFCLEGGRALLELTGEQGSAKSTLARILRRLVDHCTVPLRTAPRDERDLVIAASNGLIVAYDNLSDVKEWLSDAFCRLSTGGGIGGRRLYTDIDEVVLDAQRPCIITGINAVATRGDLLDRTIAITLPAMAAEDRRTEAEVWADVEEAHPRLLGGLLTAVAAALANRRTIVLPRKPRLADFVAWGEAAAPALGWEAGEFVAAFDAIRRDADAVAIEALPIGPALLTFMHDRDEWQGTASALLSELASLVDDETKRDRDWPKRGNRLSGMLRRLAPNLRQVGLWVAWDRSGRTATRAITITKKKEAWDRQYRQHRQHASQNPHGDADSGADEESAEDRQQSSAADDPKTIADDPDDADDGFHMNSEDAPNATPCRGNDSSGDRTDADDAQDPSIRAWAREIATFTDAELAQYRVELEATTHDDPPSPQELAALALAERMRGRAAADAPPVQRVRACGTFGDGQGQRRRAGVGQWDTRQRRSE